MRGCCRRSWQSGWQSSCCDDTHVLLMLPILSCSLEVFWCAHVAMLHPYCHLVAHVILSPVVLPVFDFFHSCSTYRRSGFQVGFNVPLMPSGRRALSCSHAPLSHLRPCLSRILTNKSWRLLNNSACTKELHVSHLWFMMFVAYVVPPCRVRSCESIGTRRRPRAVCNVQFLVQVFNLQFFTSTCAPFVCSRVIPMMLFVVSATTETNRNPCCTYRRRCCLFELVVPPPPYVQLFFVPKVHFGAQNGATRIQCRVPPSGAPYIGSPVASFWRQNLPGVFFVREP